MLVLIENEKVKAFPLSISDVKHMFQNISFTDESLLTGEPELGVFPASPTPRPECPHTQNANGDFCEKIDGVWVQTWVLTDASKEDVVARVDAQWAEVRADRNNRLANSDWTQLDDTPLTNTDKQLWGSYRQALRDITSQGDPFNILWPPQPK